MCLIPALGHSWLSLVSANGGDTLSLGLDSDQFSHCRSQFHRTAVSSYSPQRLPTYQGTFQLGSLLGGPSLSCIVLGSGQSERAQQKSCSKIRVRDRKTIGSRIPHSAFLKWALCRIILVENMELKKRKHLWALAPCSPLKDPDLCAYSQCGNEAGVEEIMGHFQCNHSNRTHSSLGPKLPFQRAAEGG